MNYKTLFFSRKLTKMFYNELTNNISFNTDAIIALNQQKSYFPETIFRGIQAQTFNRISNEVFFYD